MSYDLEFLRACCKDDAAFARLCQHLEERNPPETLPQDTFSRVFRFSPEPILITRLVDGQALALNNAFTEYTGYSEQEFLTTNPHLWADRSQRNLMVETLKRDGVIHNFAGQFLHKDGHIIHGLLSGEVINYKGEEAFLGMTRDITDYVFTSEKLRTSEERYRRVVEYQTEVICAYKPDMEFTFVNEAYCEYFGYSPQALLGTKLIEIVPEEIHSRIHEHIAYVLETKQSLTYESEVQHASGEWRWLQWIDRPILDSAGNVVEIQAVGRDVTDRKHAEISMQLLLDSMPRTTLVMFNPELEFTVVRGGILELIGLSAETMVGKTPREVFVGKHIAYSENVMRKVINGEEVETEYRFGKRILHLQMYPIRQETDTVIAGAVVAEDITERKEAEQTALKLILERNRVEIITDFITNAQHEFRTPLSVIASSLYIAERAKDSEKQVQALHKARGQVEAISHLVDELTMMARLDAEVDLEQDLKQPTNPHYLIKFALDDVAHRAKAKGVRLVTDYDETIPTLYVYQQLLAHAIGQLLDNAIHHTPADGTITIKTGCADNQIEIQIIDTGEGLTPDDMTKIFQRFYRKDAAHSTRGFGLGLPIAEKIIEIHGGTITLQSVPDEGSTFTIHLPIENK